MASHGHSRHLKRLAAPKSLPIPGKAAKYLRKPSSGRHSGEYALSLLVLLRDVLGVVRDKREAKLLLGKGEVQVDGVAAREESYPVGLMDVVSVPKISAFYRVVLSGGRLKLSAIGREEAGAKLCKLVGKRLVSGGRMQLCFHDGRTKRIEREEDRFKVGDTLKLAVPGQEISGFFKLEKNARCYVFKGRHSGEIGVLQEIRERPGSRASDAFLKSPAGEVITRKDYLFVVPEEFKI